MDEEMMEKLFPVFKALLDEDRLRILGILANGDLPVGTLAALMKLKPAALQRHLALLTENGLVQTAQAETAS
jgi:DNA-binding transcriptional ArsR family regulator